MSGSRPQCTWLDQVPIPDRQSLEVLTSFDDGGRQPGQFFGAHSIATDPKGNICTTETYRGKRIQKFVYKRLAPVTAKGRGVACSRANKARASLTVLIASASIR